MMDERVEELERIILGLVSEVINQDEQGGCIYCGGSGKEGAYGYCTDEPDCHRPDCEWLAGRQALGLEPGQPER